jgi:hypothetical protein
MLFNLLLFLCVLDHEFVLSAWNMFNILVHFIIINFKFEKQKLFFRLIFSFILGKYSIMFKLHLNVIFLSGMIYDYL